MQTINETDEEPYMDNSKLYDSPKSSSSSSIVSGYDRSPSKRGVATTSQRKRPTPSAPGSLKDQLKPPKQRITVSQLSPTKTEEKRQSMIKGSMPRASKKYSVANAKVGLESGEQQIEIDRLKMTLQIL